jgi:hypothetical protein
MQNILYPVPEILNLKIIGKAKQPCRHGAEGGIRTHAGVNPNGFQDRLVMTTSIPLHYLML